MAQQPQACRQPSWWILGIWSDCRSSWHTSVRCTYKSVTQLYGALSCKARRVTIKDMKTKPFNIRVSPEEHALFQEAAQLAGLSISAWVRSQLLECVRKWTGKSQIAQDASLAADL